jgi:ribosomal protein L20
LSAAALVLTCKLAMLLKLLKLRDVKLNRKMTTELHASDKLESNDKLLIVSALWKVQHLGQASIWAL